jgi:hypothetical protein
MRDGASSPLIAGDGYADVARDARYQWGVLYQQSGIDPDSIYRWMDTSGCAWSESV